jgi:hypothetical protein
VPSGALGRPDNEQRHYLFLAEVITVQADDRVFREDRWHFADESLRIQHYFGGGAFALTGKTVDASPS